jgi:RNA polymerase sigma-70 factor (ECF subfamily)
VAVGSALTATLGAERLRIVAALIRVTGDWDLAEDCVQDAAERALARWPQDGIPDRPGAWLTTAAHRRAVDVLRRRRTERAKLEQVQAMADRSPGAQPESDDRLVLLYSCCHPALPMEGRVALTLKTVGGLDTRQIAAAFLVSEATMSQRLLRAKNKIVHSGIGFTPPEPHRAAERTAGVLAVVYLVFNEAYVSSTGSADDPLLAREAIELAGLVTRLLPGDPEAAGLYALLLLQHSRRAARVDRFGDLVSMEDQDRALWDRRLIDAGLRALDTARSSSPARPSSPGSPTGTGGAGPYRLQAEIAALHATAPEAAATDWPAVVRRYDALLVVQPSPVIALNRAVAVGFRDGPAAGLEELEAVADDRRLAGYHVVPAVRADLLRRAGRIDEALPAYRQAIARARTDAERRFLTRRLDELGG